MLRSLKELNGYHIQATDGEIGKVRDFYFDDEAWAVRYLVVDTGGWLSGRTVLISPLSVSGVDWDGGRTEVSLTQEQVKNAPGVDTALPVSRIREIEFNRYYGYNNYWVGGSLWGPSVSPTFAGIQPGFAPAAPTPSAAPPEPITPGDVHLRSASEVTGYAIQARDGELGSVADFLIDDGDWSIRVIVVDTKPWWPGGEVGLAPGQIDGVSWSHHEVVVKGDRESIKNSPPVDMSKFTRRP